MIKNQGEFFITTKIGNHYIQQNYIQKYKGL
jgi:hypothetical protein